MSTTKAHQQYKTKDGTIVPGVTTILGILAKPALIHWAWNLGMQKQDYRKVRDKAADIGTIAHLMIECDIKGVPFDRTQYVPDNVDKAENAYLAWLEWRDKFKVITVASEKQIVSEEYKFGGTIDWVALHTDQLWLIDFKSSKDIYPEMKYQLAAYCYLWDQNDSKCIDQVHLIQLGKEDGAFSHHYYPDMKDEWEIFKHCLGIYNLTRKNK